MSAVALVLELADVAVGLAVDLAGTVANLAVDIVGFVAKIFSYDFTDPDNSQYLGDV